MEFRVSPVDQAKEDVEQFFSKGPLRIQKKKKEKIIAVSWGFRVKPYRGIFGTGIFQTV